MQNESQSRKVAEELESRQNLKAILNPDPRYDLAKEDTTAINFQTTQRVLLDFVELSKKLMKELAYNPPHGVEISTHTKTFDQSLESLLNSKGLSKFTYQMIMHKLKKKIKNMNSPFSTTLKSEGMENELAALIPTAGPICLMRKKVASLLVLGPKGVGKTTFLLNLGEQYSKELHKKVALITWGMVSEENGKYKQECELRGMQWGGNYEDQDLQKGVNEFNSYDLLLIDTPSFSRAETDKLNILSSSLSHILNLQVQIVLNAKIDLEVALEIIQIYKPLKPAALVLTQLDKSYPLGSIIDLLQKSALPLSYWLRKKDFQICLSVADPNQIAKSIWTQNERDMEA